MVEFLPVACCGRRRTIGIIRWIIESGELGLLFVVGVEWCRWATEAGFLCSSESMIVVVHGFILVHDVANVFLEVVVEKVYSITCEVYVVILDTSIYHCQVRGYPKWGTPSRSLSAGVYRLCTHCHLYPFHMISSMY